MDLMTFLTVTGIAAAIALGLRIVAGEITRGQSGSVLHGPALSLHHQRAS